MTIITSYFQIRDDAINFIKFHKVSASSDLNQKKIGKICLFDHVFSQALVHKLVTMATMNDLSSSF